MPFAYYARLTRSQQAVYKRSDGITAVPLQGAGTFGPLVDELAHALAGEDRLVCQAAAQRLMTALTERLGVPPLRVEVLAARPHRTWGELHGLYTPARGRVPPKVTVWMRTARQHRVVAFRTFLRTLLHELGHHLDCRLFRLSGSFHTEGFYKRESSLFHQLVTLRSGGFEGGAVMRGLGKTDGADGREGDARLPVLTDKGANSVARSDSAEGLGQSRRHRSPR